MKAARKILISYRNFELYMEIVPDLCRFVNFGDIKTEEIRLTRRRFPAAVDLGRREGGAPAEGPHLGRCAAPDGI